MAEALDCLPRGGVAIGQRQDLSGKIALVTNFMKDFDNGRHVRVAKANCVPVAIGEMHVADVASGGAQGIGDRGLLEVHVKQVGEYFEVVCLQAVKKANRIVDTVKEVGFVAI